MRGTLVALVVSLLVVTVGVAPAALAGGVDAGTSAVQADDVCAEGEASFPVTSEDATNTTVEIPEEPERIVTLNPSAAQTLWEFGAQDKVVGVSQFAAYLDGAEEKANVSTSTFAQYNAERIVSLETDLVLAPNTIPDQEVDRLRRAGLTVYKFETATSIEDIRQKTLLMGALVGECQAARETNRWVDQNLESVDAAVDGREEVRTMYVSFGSTVGADTFIHGMIESSGATNVVADAGQSGFIRQVNAELVAQQDPEYFVVTRPNPSFASQAPYNSTTAVEEGNYAVVNVNYLSQPAPRSVVYAVRNMTESFHSEAYGPEDYVSREEAAAADPTTTTTTTTTNAATTTTTTTTTTTNAATTTTTVEDGQGQPGLGVLAAVVGLLGALFLLRRRA